MSAEPTNQPTLLSNYASLVEILSDFLVVSFHTILYTRSLYPQSTFLLTQAYDFPVHQNRHPKVCRWILDTVAAIQDQLVKGVVKRIVFVVYSVQGEVMERFVFDVERFPVVLEQEIYTEFTREAEAGQDGDEDGKGVGVSVVDVEEQLRATVRKLAYSTGKLGGLPKGCTYTVAVELKDDAEAPVGHPQPWVPSGPSLQTGQRGNSERIGNDLGGIRTVPVRLVEAGEFLLESWIEEGKAKRKDDG